MPLDKFVLIVVAVIAAAGATVWIATMVAASVQLPGVIWFVAVPALLAAYVVWRVIADRLNNPEDDHYDNIDK